MRIVSCISSNIVLIQQSKVRMTTTTFPIDPGDMPALKRWLAAQEPGSENIHSPLRPVEIDEILIGPDVLRQLRDVLQRARIVRGSPLVLGLDETPMLRARDAVKRLAPPS